MIPNAPTSRPLADLVDTSDSQTHSLRSCCLQCDSSVQAPHPSQILPSHASHRPAHLPSSGSGLCAHLHLELQHPQSPSVQTGLVGSSTLVKPVMDNTTCSWALQRWLDHRISQKYLTNSVNKKIIWRFLGNLEKKVLVLNFPHFF